MKSQARVVVIGGGVVGVGALYALSKKGWSDVMLIERREITSGSTWHAAGLAIQIRAVNKMIASSKPITVKVV